MSGDVGRPAVGPTAIATDNQALMDIVEKPGSTARTRHYERMTMLIKELYMRDIVYPEKVTTDKMVADIFTKAVDKDTFLRCRDYMLNVANQPGLELTFMAGVARRLARL